MRRDVFQAIADPVRRDIIELLAKEILTDEEKRSEAAIKAGKASRDAELDRRDIMKEGQKAADKGALPPLVRSGE